MSEMSYKQAIKVLSETKVADMPYKGCGDNHKMYDVARRMAIEALKEKAVSEMRNSAIRPIAAHVPVSIPCKEGDTIPFRTNTGYVISYIVEKVKIREDGTVKIRCRHGGGGQNRSFTPDEVMTLIKTGGTLPY